MANVKVEGVTMTMAAARNAELVGCSPAEDVQRVRDGLTYDALLDECLAGCERYGDTADGWREYADDIRLAAAFADLHAAAEAVVVELAVQDAAGANAHAFAPPDPYTGGNAQVCVEVWRDHAALVGDGVTVEAIDVLGKPRAAEVYAAARAKA
jgi:hypothetical protein